MSPRTCPVCRKAPPAADYRPFCSKRCADVDLQRWFAGVYAVPAVENEHEDDEPAADGGPDVKG